MANIMRVAKLLIRANHNWKVTRLDIQSTIYDNEIDGYVGYLDVEGLGTIRINDNGDIKCMFRSV